MEQGPPKVDIAKVTAPKTDPQKAFREKALGIDSEPTGLGKWLVYFTEATGGMNIDQKVTDINRQMPDARSTIDALWNAASVDTAGKEQKGVTWMQNRKALRYFEGDGKQVLSKLGITPEEAQELGKVMNETIGAFMNRVAYSNAVEGPIKDDEPALINLAKDEAALALVLRRHIPPYIETSQPHLGMLSELRTATSKPAQRYATQEPDFGAEWRDKDDQLVKSAEAYAYGWAGAVLKDRLVDQHLGKYLIPGKGEHIVTGMKEDLNMARMTGIDQAAEIDFFTYKDNRNLVMSLQKDIETVAVMMKGEEPDPARDISKRITEELQRVNKVATEAAAEEEKYRRLMEETAARRQTAETYGKTLTGVAGQLKQVSTQAEKVSAIRQQRAVIEEKLGKAAVKHEILTLEQTAFTDTEAYNSFADNWSAIAEVYGLDEVTQKAVGPIIEGMKGLLPLLSGPTKETIQATLSTLLGQVKAQIGEDKLASMKQSLNHLREPLPRVSLDDTLRTSAEDALRKSLSEVK